MNNWEKICEEVKRQVDNLEDDWELIKINSGQYKDAVCIYYKDIKNSDICKIHIRPYRITKKDIKKAVFKATGMDVQCGTRIWFNETKENNFVDYDPTSENFHKRILRVEDIKLQVVLCRNSKNGGSPDIKGFKEQMSDKEKEEYINKVIESKMYFPNIDDEDSEKSLSELVKDALVTIG